MHWHSVLQLRLYSMLAHVQDNTPPTVQDATGGQHATGREWLSSFQGLQTPHPPAPSPPGAGTQKVCARKMTLTKFSFGEYHCLPPHIRVLGGGGRTGRTPVPPMAVSCAHTSLAPPLAPACSAAPAPAPLPLSPSARVHAMQVRQGP